MAKSGEQDNDMDRKFLIQILTIVLALTILAGTARSERFYSSTYRHSSGDRYTIPFWNTRWEHIDSRIDALEDLGSDVFSTVSISGNVAGDTSVSAESSTDMLTLVGGSNVTLTGTASSDSIQIDVSTTPLDVLGGGGEVVGGTTDIDFDSNFSITDEGSNEAGVALVDDPTIAGFLTVTEYVDIAEMSAPANPAANAGRIYTADNGGTTTLYFKDSAGTATNLLVGATDEAIQDSIYNNVLSGTQTLITVTYDDPGGEVDYVVNNDLGDAGWDWSNVVDTDITNTLTASLFVGSGSTTNAIDLATAEVAGTLGVGNIADQYLRNDANDTTTGNIQLYDAVGDSPMLSLVDSAGEQMALQKIDAGVAGIYADTDIIGFLPNGDIDDYLSIATSSDVPTISTIGNCNLKITSSSNTIDFDGSNIIGIGSLASDDNLVLDDGVGDSPYLQFVDANAPDKTFTIQKLDSGAATMINDEGAIVLMPSGDVDDYFWFSTAANEPLMTAVGSTSMNYGSASVTDHTFLSDGTGDAEVVLPNDSIGPAELNSTAGAYDFGSVTSLEVPNGAGPTVDVTGEIAVDSNADGDLIDMGWLTYYDGTRAMYALGVRTALIANLTNWNVVAYDATNDELVIGTQYGTVSAGTRTIYVDRDGGSDSNLGTSGSKLATIQKAWDVIPPIVTEPIVIDIDADAAYAEQLTFNYKKMASSAAGITVQGALTSVDTGTADADSTTASLEDDGQGWTPSTHAGQLVVITGGTGSGQERFIRDNDADTLTIAGLFETAPDATSTFSIYSPGTINTPGAGNTSITMQSQSGVTIKYIEFVGGAAGIDISDGCQNIAIQSCEFDTQDTNGNGINVAGSELTVNTAYIHAAERRGVNANAGSFITLYDTYISGCNTDGSSTAAGVHAKNGGYALVYRAYIDGNDNYGTLCQWNAIIQFAAGTNVSSIVNHNAGGDYGIRSTNGGHTNSATSQTFNNNDTDQSADAATFSTHT